MNTGDKIRTIRTHRKLTQKELAKLSGVSEIAIRKYEANARTPQREQLSLIAQALEVSPNALLDDSILIDELKTTGDIMLLISLIDKTVGLQFFGERDGQGRLNPQDMTFRITHDKVNECIADWEQIRHSYYTYVMSMGDDNSNLIEQLDFMEMTNHLKQFEHNMTYRYTDNLSEDDVSED